MHANEIAQNKALWPEFYIAINTMLIVQHYNSISPPELHSCKATMKKRTNIAHIYC